MILAPETRAVVRRVFACYFLSGALGLIYQILWLRKLLLVFGSTVHAVSTVLTVFFGGLALGSWLFGRWIDRRERAGLRWYAFMEMGVGLYAFLTPWLFMLVQHIYIPIYRQSNFSPTVLVGASFVCATAILLLPTVLLGGTFPVLSRYLIRSSAERGGAIAGLYGLNTAGAMLGTVFVYASGLPVLGLMRTLQCAGVLNLGIGMLCLSFDRRLEELEFRRPSTASPSTPAVAPDVPDRTVAWVLLAFALSGFSAMVYEVAWTRVLSLVLSSSIYAFCIMLATFLGGIAIGSFWIQRRLAAIREPLTWFIALEGLLGVCGVASVFLFTQLPDWFVTLWPLTRQSFTGLVWLQVLLSAAIMIAPTLIMGMLFPLVSELVTNRFAAFGRQLGSAYAINTLGGILGSFLAGFVLIPLWGLPWAIVAAAMVNLLAAALVYVRFGTSWSWVGRLGLACGALISGALVSGAVITSSWQQQVFSAGVYLNPDEFVGGSIRRNVANTKLLFYRDSLNATVSVHQLGSTIFLKVGGKTDASNGLDMGTQVLFAHIPLLLHPDPKRALVIGLGSGVTLGHAGRYPLTTLHCAELDPAVIEGARYFRDYNFHIHDDPRVRIFAADGRNFLLASPQTYDVIISEPSNPWMAGLAYLFTREFYQLAKRRLAPGGIMCQWVQLYRLFPEDVTLMLRTFHHEFPYVSIWSPAPGDLLMIGSQQPHKFDYPTLVRRMAAPSIHDALATMHLERPDVLLHTFWFANREVEAVTAGDSSLHEDDQPFLEFDAPKALYADAVTAANITGLRQFIASPEAIVTNRPARILDPESYQALSLFRISQEQLKDTEQALTQWVTLDPSSKEAWIGLSGVYQQMQQPLRARDALMQVLAVDPSDATANRLLGRLHWQQGQLQEARPFYQQAVATHPADTFFAQELGSYYLAAELPAWAAEYYRSALSQDSKGRRSLLLGYSKVLSDLKRWDDAEKVAELGSTAFPDNAQFPLMRGNMALEQHEWDAAVTWLTRALILTPSLADAHYGLARAAEGRQQLPQAVEHLKHALRYDSYHRQALELLHRLQSEAAARASR
ncbi:MAG: fused MFS/spermidine synthase [Candidatus Omnitrophica bacterium]|nr:fused MFS/spermidine synthase [Candidatus Omnitrophota bacterium]